MGFSFRKSVPLGRLLRLNISKTGVGMSARAGRMTVNSRGRASIRLAEGLSFRFKL